MKFLVLPIDGGSHRTRLGMEVAVWKRGPGKVSGDSAALGRVLCLLVEFLVLFRDFRTFL